MFICGLYTFFRAMSIKILCLFFNWVGLSFCLLVVEFFTYSGCVCVCLVAQLCLTLCDPMDWSPPGASVRGDSPGKHIGMGCHVPLQGSRSPILQADSLPAEPPEEPHTLDTRPLSRASQMALVVKNLPAKVGDLRNVGSIPGMGRSSSGGHGNPLQDSCLENPTDREAWWGYSPWGHRVTHDWSNLAQHRPLLDIWFTNTFSHLVHCLFIFLTMFFMHNSF